MWLSLFWLAYNRYTRRYSRAWQIQQQLCQPAKCPSTYIISLGLCSMCLFVANCSGSLNSIGHVEHVTSYRGYTLAIVSTKPTLALDAIAASLCLWSLGYYCRIMRWLTSPAAAVGRPDTVTGTLWGPITDAFNAMQSDSVLSKNRPLPKTIDRLIAVIISEQ